MRVTVALGLVAAARGERARAPRRRPRLRHGAVGARARGRVARGARRRARHERGDAARRAAHDAAHARPEPREPLDAEHRLPTGQRRGHRARGRVVRRGEQLVLLPPPPPTPTTPPPPTTTSSSSSYSYNSS